MKHGGFSLREHLRRVVYFLWEFFFPSGCALCGGSLLTLDETWYGLCGGCRGGLEEESVWLDEAERCDLCGRPLVSENGRCLACRNGGARSFDRLAVLFPYSGKYRALFGAYKFGKNTAPGRYFAEKISRALRAFAEDGAPPVVVPVPSRPGKIKQSGWDQVEYLARLLERGADRQKPFAVYRCLKRLPSKAQKELGREERRGNLRGRIVPLKKIPPAVVVLDDVLTTGSTMDACAAALKESGAQEVYGVCLMYD